jgi:hypothetical protein
VHSRFKTILLASIAICAPWTVSPVSGAENPQMIVSVYDDARVPANTLARAERQATKIFWRAGLDVNWLNCADTNNASCASAFTDIGGRVHLVLRITSNVASSTSDTAFGIAYLGSDGTGQYCDVFWERARDLESAAADVGLILGSVMAHEMGHLLLGSNSHAVSGIMRAHWEHSELRRISMGSLLFLPEQSQRMGARVTERAGLLMSRGERPRE